MLALPMPGQQQPARFVIHRPATGRSRQTMTEQVGGRACVCVLGYGEYERGDVCRLSIALHS